MKKNYKIACLGCAALLMSGCGQRSNKKNAEPVSPAAGMTNLVHFDSQPKPVPIDSLKGSDVLVSIGDRKLTKTDFDASVNLRLSLYRSRHPQARKEVLNAYRYKLERRMIPDFTLETLIALDAAARNIKPTDNERQTLEERYLKTFGHRGMTFSNLVSGYVSTGFNMTREFDSDLIVSSYQNRLYSNELAVSDTEVIASTNRVGKYNRMVQATNDIQFAQATNVWKLATAPGADFAKLADRYSEDSEKKPGGDLGDCDASDYGEDEKTWNAISLLKDGEVSPVIETDIGLDIFKVLGRQLMKDGKSLASLHLARIHFRLAAAAPIYSLPRVKAELKMDKLNYLK